MSNTYTQIHFHVIFAVRNRISCIDKTWRDDLYKYIIAIIQNQGHKVLAIGGIADHIHILIGFRPAQSLSALVQEIKRDSSKWINQKQLVKGKFSWQNGYGAFSYAKEKIPTICRYIERQEEHHKKKTFREEYIKILQENEVDFDERYIFKEIE